MSAPSSTIPRFLRFLGFQLIKAVSNAGSRIFGRRRRRNGLKRRNLHRSHRRLRLQAPKKAVFPGFPLRIFISSTARHGQLPSFSSLYFDIFDCFVYCCCNCDGKGVIS